MSQITSAMGAPLWTGQLSADLVCGFDERADTLRGPRPVRDDAGVVDAEGGEFRAPVHERGRRLARLQPGGDHLLDLLVRPPDLVAEPAQHGELVPHGF